MTDAKTPAQVTGETTGKPQCRPGCLLDCPYCHRHVVDVYGHLKHNPCQAAAQA